MGIVLGDRLDDFVGTPYCTDEERVGLGWVGLGRAGQG